MGVRVRSGHLQRVRKQQQKLYNNQKDLQKRAKVGQDAISKFLRGISISRHNFDKICDCLEFSQEEINEFMEVVDNFHLSQSDDESDMISPDINIEKYDPNFIGRENAILHLDNMINKGTKLIQIIATGGTGKTLLANKYLRNRFNTVIEFPIARERKDIASIENLLEFNLRKLNSEPGRDLMVSLQRLKQKLQTEEIGILIDNLEPALDASGKFVEQHCSYVELLRILTDSSVKSFTLITSREKLHEPSIELETYKLPGLTLETWEEYFNNYGILSDHNSLQEIRDAFGGNAKAMDVISKAIIKDYHGDLERYWLKNKKDLLIEPTLENLIKEQFKRLQEINLNHAYNLLCRLGCYRYQDQYTATVPEKGLFCLLWDVNESQHERIIKVLKERGLVEFNHDYYWLHPVIRQEAIDRLRNSDDWEKANIQAAEFWTESVKIVETVKDALTAFEAYYHYLDIKHYNEIGKIIFRRRRINTINRWDHFKGGINLFDDFRRLGLIGNLRIIQKLQYSINFNLYGDSILYFQFGFSCINWWLGNINLAIEQLKERLDLIIEYQQKLNDFSYYEYDELYLGSLTSIGYCYLHLFNLHQSEEYFNKVLELSDKYHKNHYRFNFYVESYVVLAFIESCKNNPDINDITKKIEYVCSPDIISYQHINFYCSAYRLLFAGLAYKNIGKIAEAKEKVDQIFQENHENGSYIYQQVVGLAHSLKAEIYRIENNFEKAISHHQESIVILERIDGKCDIAEAYFQIALTYQKMGNKTKSEEYFNKAMYLWSPEQINAPKQIERVLKAMN